MKHLKKIIHVFSLLTLAACGSSPDEPAPAVPTPPGTPVAPAEPERMPMSFAPLASPVSRSDMYPAYDAFKVWTYKHTSSAASSDPETVMPGYICKYISGAWQYDGSANPADPDIASQLLKYWDGSAASYSFYAFAPASVAGVTCDDQGISIDDMRAHDIASPVDVVIASHTRLIPSLADRDELDISHDFGSLATFADVVPLRFHHLLSKVTFKIYNSGDVDADLRYATISMASGSIFTLADFVSDHWVADASDTGVSTLSSVTFSTPKSLPKLGSTADALTLTSYYEFPQDLGKEITVSLNINDIVMTATLKLPNSAWLLDKEYIYYINIQVGQGSPILIDLTLDQFVQGESVDETQTNW